MPISETTHTTSPKSRNEKIVGLRRASPASNNTELINRKKKNRESRPFLGQSVRLGHQDRQCFQNPNAPQETPLSKMNDSLLTIVIPTYNRAKHLESLLRQLDKEVVSSKNQICVLILDNNSQDDTYKVASWYAQRHETWKVISHTSNIGADRNFLFGVSSVHTKYFWMIGDDDMPRAGFLRLLVDMLEAEAPDITYLNAYGVPEVSAGLMESLEWLNTSIITATDVARKINDMTMFISAWIVNIHSLRARNVDLCAMERYVGTFLIQLGWTLPLVSKSSKIIEVCDTCIFATNGDNWGGYNFIQVYGINFPTLIQTLMSEDIIARDAFIDQYLRVRLPLRVRGLKTGLFGNGFGREPLAFFRTALVIGNDWRFWRYVAPSFFPSIGKFFRGPSRFARMALNSLLRLPN